MKNKFASPFLFICIVVFIAPCCLAQESYSQWDKDFKPMDVNAVFEFEKSYADSTERDSSVEQYYSRTANYRVTAKYLGEKRTINKEIYNSMKRVSKLYIGDSAISPALDKTEYKFDISGTVTWIPMEADVEDGFQKEIKKNDVVTLYCVFFNEHTKSKRLFNIFLISEFRKGLAAPY